MFEKILIANRGEIALRILRAAKELGISTVACIPPPIPRRCTSSSPMNPCASGLQRRATPTSTFLRSWQPARSPAPRRCIPATASFRRTPVSPRSSRTTASASSAPSAEHIRIMGDKIEAKKTAIALGIPCVPGSDGAITTDEEGLAVAARIGYPVLVKAASGGGGRGMKLALTAEDLSSALSTARTEAKAAFGDDAVYLEKYLQKPRHIEIQILGDGQGHAIHLGERDCSLQRRHQKVWEESPSPALNERERARIGEVCAKAMRDMGYSGAGTIEFLYENGEFYFIEMNTRIQVEHPVTEMLTGFDLVHEQIKIAGGAPLTIEQDDVVLRGHAIECRINAEHPSTFRPSPGKITYYHPQAVSAFASIRRSTPAIRFRRTTIRSWVSSSSTAAPAARR